VAGVLDVVGRRLGVLADRRSTPSSPRLDWERLDGRGLRGAAQDVQAAISALEHQQRLLLGLIDERRAFDGTGARDAADWAANSLGVDRRRAADAVDVGRRLQQLPRLADAAAAGRLTTDQARPASRLADSATDGAWARQAEALPPAVLARQLARRRRPSAADHRAARAARHFRSWEQGHELLFRGSLPIDDGRRLLAAVERAMPDRDPHADVPATPDQRRADGLAALAGAHLAADADPDRATVLVIAELAAIEDGDPAATAELEASQPLATATARRLLCDSRTQLAVQDRRGVLVGVGTTQRTVGPQLRRALVARDGRCRFGACTNTRFLHAHHVVHWPSPTTMGNLVLLCFGHHHAVHEGGWTLAGDPNGELQAVHPTDGTVLVSRPQHRCHVDPPPDPPPGPGRHDPATSTTEGRVTDDRVTDDRGTDEPLLGRDPESAAPRGRSRDDVRPDVHRPSARAGPTGVP
jgi:hypothetical protein